MLTPEQPDEYLAGALEREIVRHRSGQFDALGDEYDPVLAATLPFEERASPAFHFALRFWDDWADASRHEWQYYDGIGRDDWPRLAAEVIAALRAHAEPRNPLLTQHFGAPRPGLFRRLWSCFRSSSAQQADAADDPAP